MPPFAGAACLRPGQIVNTGSRMRVDHAKRRRLFPQMQNDADKHRMFEHVGEISGVKGVAIVHPLRPTGGRRTIDREKAGCKSRSIHPRSNDTRPTAAAELSAPDRRHGEAFAPAASTIDPRTILKLELPGKAN